MDRKIWIQVQKEHLIYYAAAFKLCQGHIEYIGGTFY